MRFPPPKGLATHGETSLGSAVARLASKRRQCDDQAAARKGEGIEPRNGKTEGRRCVNDRKARVGARQGESTGDLGGVVDRGMAENEMVQVSGRPPGTA